MGEHVSVQVGEAQDDAVHVRPRTGGQVTWAASSRPGNSAVSSACGSSEMPPSATIRVRQCALGSTERVCVAWSGWIGPKRGTSPSFHRQLSSKRLW